MSAEDNTGLHAQLLAAVEARRQLAHAAEDAFSKRWLLGKTPLLDHLAANDPATVIRHCDEDLDILVRHQIMRDDEQNVCAACGWLGVMTHPDACDELVSLARRYAIDVPDAVPTSSKGEAT